MDRVVVNDWALMAEICAMLETELPPRSASVCRVRDGKLLGGVVYHNLYGRTSIQAHVASRDPHWLNRDMLYAMFAYPFLQLGVARMFATVAEDNPHAMAFNQNLGLRPVARVEGYYKGDVACVIHRLDREDCRFLNIKPRNIKWNSQLKVA